MAEDYTPVFRNRLETESNSRISQIGICFANAFHMFFQHRSWMVLPMTAVLSLIAGLAIREDFFETMEATMTGAFVLVGVCIWNGSFSSIQTICRDQGKIPPEAAFLFLYDCQHAVSAACMSDGDGNHAGDAVGCGDPVYSTALNHTMVCP